MVSQRVDVHVEQAEHFQEPPLPPSAPRQHQQQQHQQHQQQQPLSYSNQGESRCEFMYTLNCTLILIFISLHFSHSAVR